MTPPRMRSCVFALLLLITLRPQSTLAGPLPPTNQLFGFISSNRTLTSSHPGPVYDVLGDLVVMPGVTLTIQPGVTLRMAANDILQGGSYFGLVELEVRGHLQANASYGDSIRVIEATSGQTWGHISVVGAGTATIENVVISGALIGLNAGSTAPVSLRRSSIRNCSSGAGGGWAGDFAVESCVLTGLGPSSGGHGLSLGQFATVTTTMPSEPLPTVISRFGVGVYVTPPLTISNLIVRDNDHGIVNAQSGPVTVSYCTVARNLGHPILLTGSSTSSLINSIVAQNNGQILYCTASFSNLWLNGGLTGVALGPQIAGFNPFFLDPANNDFRLAENSIFKGYSSSGGEIGAYGPGAGLPTSRSPTTWGRLKSLYR